jgi:MoaA/NifB/PqqE/SkfB family radical SAM enzyme
MKKCVAPLSSLVIDQRSKIAPCCAWNGKYKDIDINKPIDQTARTLSDFRISAIMNELQFDKTPSCSQCTRGSTQYLMHNKYADPNINYKAYPTITNLHLKVSNFCNLACRMCDPDSSSVIAAERNITYNNSKHPHITSSLPIESTLYKSILENLKNIRYLWCSGGEPLSQKEIWSIIEYCYNNDLAKGIVLKFNTNGTVVLTDQQITQLLAFKEVQFDISVDGIGPIGEYIRTKSNWDKWEKNFKIYNDLAKKNSNLIINTNTAVSIFNVHVIDDLFNYFEKFRTENFGIQGSFTPVHYPIELSVQQLSKSVKQELLRTLSDKKSYDFLSLLRLPSADNNINIKDYIDTLDNNAISSNLYKNYKPFSEVDPSWYKRITSDS